MTRAPSTYDDDFFAWTQEQAAALRALSQAGGAGRLDIAHVAEEIEDLGKRDLREVNSFLVRLFEHMMKIQCAPRARDVRHWRVEALNFQLSARRSFSPSMRRLIRIEELWHEGRRLVTVGTATSHPPCNCPFTLDESLSAEFDLDSALAKLAGGGDAPGH